MIRLHCRSLLFMGALVSAFSATAVQYYWDTTNPPGNVQWTEGTAINSIDTLFVNDPLTTTQSVSNDGSIELNNSMSNTNDITGTGTLNTNSQTLSLGGTINNANLINVDNGGTLDLQSSASITTSANISNSGLVSCDATLSGGGQLVNNSDGTISFGTNTLLSLPLINYGDFTINNNIARSAAITNNNNLVIAADIGGGAINNEPGATLEFAADASTFGLIVNEGTFTVSGNSSTLQAINNSGMMTVNASLGGGGPSVNNDGTLTLNPGGSIGTTIFNNIDLFCSGGNAGGISNDGDMHVTGPLQITNTDIQNYNHIFLQENIDGILFNNGNGTLEVTGNRQISGNCTSTGQMNFTINTAMTYDSLTVGGDLDVSSSLVNIDSTFTGDAGETYEWDILNSPNLIYDDVGTIVNIPASTATEIWDFDFITNSILRVSLVNNNTPPPPTPGFTPLPGVATQIANVLDRMQTNITNSGQQELIDAVNSATTQDQYNYLLNNLQPDTNSTASSVLLALQSIGFNKVEVRVAGPKRNNNARKSRVKKGGKKAAKKSSVKPVAGLATGDINPDTAMWIAGVGSLSKQHARGDNQGYRAKILGAMLGVDTKLKNDDIYGIAFGVSNANVYNLENTTFTTRILGYNLMLYGANNFKNDFFDEWIVSGVINKNHGTRVFGINGTDLSTESSYRGSLVGGRFNFGKNFKLNDTFNLSQVNTIQYVLVHQSAYNETGSVAALQVSTKQNQSILTLGTGFRLGIFNDNPWLNGNRELRAMVTYDAISPDQATTANFVVGSDSFVMTSSSARWAGRFGADYSFTIATRLSLQFSYDYEVRSGYYDNFGEIKLRYVF